MKPTIKIFTESLLNWFAVHGRHDLPWQKPYEAYRVWVSEIMLQQTQVKTVIPYFLKFMVRFPDIHAVAEAPLDDVLAAWSGLGYYSRARNLHRAAQQIVLNYGGIFPEDIEDIQNLPGIGRSTAAAIGSLAFQQPTAILDGNVKRVLSRYFKIPGSDRAFENQLWELAQACMPQQQCRAYTQAIMDLGATCCTPHQPSCKQCPLQQNCEALVTNVVLDYPERKPKKIRPIRREKFLILHSENQQIYLEQRPLSGIWGGLWCLPSINSDVEISAHLKTTYDLNMISAIPFMTYKHSFTHFHLQIAAYSIGTELNHPLPGAWYDTNDLEKLGLPKPVKDILGAFFNT